MSRKIISGCKIRLTPTETQAAQLDQWRRHTVSLWNLLLNLQHAAYDGHAHESKHARLARLKREEETGLAIVPPDYKPHLGWRKIWADVVEENYEIAHRNWERGKTIRVGENKGKVIPPRTGREPQPPSQELLDKILNPGTGENRPGLFIWEPELLKLMARLKNVPWAGFVGDLHSHAGQAVCKTLCGAIRTMLVERKKANGRDIGFPKFKRHNYASGSIYFANTQLVVDHDRKWIKFPHGIGQIKRGAMPAHLKDGKLLGARAWREGEQWWLSAQFEIEEPEALPTTGREGGVKTAATVIATVFDGSSIEQFKALPEDKRAARRLKLAARKEARRRDAATAKAEKLAERKKRQGKTLSKKPRVRRSRRYYKILGRIAKMHAHGRNQRTDLLHNTSRKIVNSYDRITIERMAVKEMMRKPQSKRFRRHLGQEQQNGKPLNRFRSVRKLTQRAAMATFLSQLRYKAERAGRDLIETDVAFPRVQECSVCGKLHPEMKDGRPEMRCECGNVMDRRANAAINEYVQGQITKAATEIFGVDQS